MTFCPIKPPAASVSTSALNKSPDVVSLFIIMADEKKRDRAIQLADQATELVAAGRVEVLDYPSKRL